MNLEKLSRDLKSFDFSTADTKEITRLVDKADEFKYLNRLYLAAAFYYLEHFGDPFPGKSKKKYSPKPKKIDENLNSVIEKIGERISDPNKILKQKFEILSYIRVIQQFKSDFEEQE